VGVQRKIAANLLALALGLSLVAMLVALAVHPSNKWTPILKVIVGTKDEIDYYHAATREDAQALGRVLQAIGFFNNRGSTVLLSKGAGGTRVTFVLDNGGWDHPATVYSFEEIGRRIAPSIGGYPIQVRLIDWTRNLHKELTVGKAVIGARDEIYYFGAATEADATILGNALQTAGYLTDRGASVVLSKGDGTAIAFVLDDGAWSRPEVTAGFERLVRQVAESAGGLPIQLRLLNSKMEPKKEWTVE
jgi:hypothetical protein